MKGKRVLLVDDSEAMRRFVGEVLAHEGACVTVAHDGLSGIVAARKKGPFDLVVLDMVLPDMSGWGVLDGLLARGLLDCPFVFFSASADQHLQDRARELGARDYIVKPVSAHDLVARLRQSVQPD